MIQRRRPRRYQPQFVQTGTATRWQGAGGGHILFPRSKGLPMATSIPIKPSGFAPLDGEITCDDCGNDAKLGFQFSYAYQPIVDLAARQVYAYEALVRGPNGESASSVLSRVNEENRYRFDQACRGIGNPTTRAQIPSLQPPSKPARCLRRHDHWADHWASPGPDAALTRPFGATGSATSTARPTARSRRRSVCPLTNRCVDRARHRVLPGLTRPSPGRLGPPARHNLHPVRHTRPTAVARVPGRRAAPARPRRCAPGSA